MIRVPSELLYTTISILLTRCQRQHTMLSEKAADWPAQRSRIERDSCSCYFHVTVHDAPLTAVRILPHDNQLISANINAQSQSSQLVPFHPCVIGHWIIELPVLLSEPVTTWGQLHWHGSLECLGTVARHLVIISGQLKIVQVRVVHPELFLHKQSFLHIKWYYLQLIGRQLRDIAWPLDPYSTLI